MDEAAKRRALNVLVDRCKGCLCCHPGHVPGTRLCKHPMLPSALPVVDADYERESVPAWCPAPGVVVMLAGPPEGPADFARRHILKTVAEDMSAIMDAGPGPRGAGVRLAVELNDPAAPFHVCVQGVAACDRSLVLKGVVPAADVTASRRCKRGPCKVMWPRDG